MIRIKNIVIINVLVVFKDWVCVVFLFVWLFVGGVWLLVFGKVVGIMYGLYVGLGFLG